MALHPAASGTFPDEAHQFAFPGLARGPEFLVGDILDPLPHRRVVAFVRPFRAQIFAIELVKFRCDPGRGVDAIRHATDGDLLDCQSRPHMVPHLTRDPPMFTADPVHMRSHSYRECRHVESLSLGLGCVPQSKEVFPRETQLIPIAGEVLVHEVMGEHVVAVTPGGRLFGGACAWHIVLGRPGAARAGIGTAAKAIGAHEFISALPQGYDTDVAKRGGRLSSGQKQLVSFARAFLADRRVLILDEATSSLDLPTERLVRAALDTLLADRTAVIIAHRLSTVEIADRVLVVDDGRIVADGPPSDVLPTLQIA